MSPRSLFSEMISPPLSLSPTLSPTSTYSNLPDTPMTTNSRLPDSSTGMIFFTHHTTRDQQDNSDHVKELFTSTPWEYPPSTSNRHRHRHRSREEDIPKLDLDSDRLGLGRRERLPDEPYYPSGSEPASALSLSPYSSTLASASASDSGSGSAPTCTSTPPTPAASSSSSFARGRRAGLAGVSADTTRTQISDLSSQESDSRTTQNDWLGLTLSSTGEIAKPLLPSPYSSYATFKKGKRNLPFGHTFLSPVTQISGPSVPMGVLPAPSSQRFQRQHQQQQPHQYSPEQQSRPPAQVPPSSWRFPHPGSQTPQLSEGDSEVKSAQPTYPSEMIYQRPSYGDSRRNSCASGDSEETIRPGNGFVALNDLTPSSFSSPQSTKPAPTGGVAESKRKHSDVETCAEIFGPSRTRSTSTSQIPQTSRIPLFSTSVVTNSRPTSPVGNPLDTQDNGTQEDKHSTFKSLGVMRPAATHRHTDTGTISRFSRPISPLLPEDLSLSTMIHKSHSQANKPIHLHRTVSSGPERPRSPATAKESLHAVLTKHPLVGDNDEQVEGSVDKLVQAAQRYQSASIPFNQAYLPRTPPMSPPDRTMSYRTYQTQQALYEEAMESKPKRGFAPLASTFAPSPPPSSPVALSPTANFSGHNSLGEVRERFDVNKVSERLRTHKGRIIFAELEGVGEPFQLHGDDPQETGTNGHCRNRTMNQSGRRARTSGT
ncbi:uncharacterized protein IL334_004304 [Kwoniella shivajii]|uniref:Uncharacterized protein n=1 Tax=Kwoniella shivajii TaxID=564305 RepID=A0ABZ1D1B6_9TREE|nr:hypothetical protein IL334_004304 [Kwoniella shivajii]